MQYYNPQNVNFFFEKLKRAGNIKNDAELAIALNIKPNTLSGWRKRGIGDWPSIFAFCEARKISIEKMLFDEKVDDYILNDTLPNYKINSLQKLNIDENVYNALIEKVKMLEKINALQQKVIEHYESGDSVASKIG